MRLRAPLSILMLCVTSASAQTAGEVRDLRLSTRDLIFRVEDLTPRIKSIAFTETRTETRIALPGDILFDFDKADIRIVAEPALKQAADLIRQTAKGTVRIEGYTDSKGLPAYNIKLSDRRAASVKNWLVEHEGLKQVSFQTKGFGASNQVAPNAKPDGSDDPEGRQKNRRVEIVFSRQAK
jgi:Outer membrane protein and related peptidoglycan-associated (lipo)proteins